jgi:hypothetical protein
VRSVRRAFDTRNLLSEERPVITLQVITEATRPAKTTVLRPVQIVEETCLLRSQPSGHTADPGLWRWALLGSQSVEGAAANT